MKSERSIVRTLASADLDDVVALDRSHSGVSRRGFFAKRFAAMDRHPQAFVSIAATEGRRLQGYVLAHVLDGEFGGVAPVAVLDAIGVAAEQRGRGIGTALMDALIAEARARGARELRTRVDWGQPGVLDFFRKSGFSLAPRLVLERPTGDAHF